MVNNNICETGKDKVQQRLGDILICGKFCLGVFLEFIRYAPRYGSEGIC